MRRNGRGTERLYSVPFRSEFNIPLNHKGHEGMTYPNTLFLDTPHRSRVATATRRCPHVLPARPGFRMATRTITPSCAKIVRVSGIPTDAAKTAQSTAHRDFGRGSLPLCGITPSKRLNIQLSK